MENSFNFPDKLYSFTKIQGAIKTWKLDEVTPITENTAIYYNNYGESKVFSRDLINASFYFEKEEDCFVAWVEALEKKKQQIIKRFEKKFNEKYSIYSTRLLLEEYPEIKERIKKVAESFKP